MPGKIRHRQRKLFKSKTVCNILTPIFTGVLMAIANMIIAAVAAGVIMGVLAVLETSIMVSDDMQKISLRAIFLIVAVMGLLITGGTICAYEYISALLKEYRRRH